METQRPLNSQSSLEKEEWSWRNFWTTKYYKSYSHQNSMVLAQKNRPMEQDREPRDKTHAPMDVLFLTKEARRHNGAKIASLMDSSV